MRGDPVHVLATLALAAVLLSACNDQGQAGQPAASSPAQPASTTPAETPGATPPTFPPQGLPWFCRYRMFFTTSERPVPAREMTGVKSSIIAPCFWTLADCELMASPGRDPSINFGAVDLGSQWTSYVTGECKEEPFAYCYSVFGRGRPIPSDPAERPPTGCDAVYEACVNLRKQHPALAREEQVVTECIPQARPAQR